MSVNLNSGLRKFIFAAVCVAAVAIYIGVISRHYLAVQLAVQPNSHSLARAAKLEPWNAEPQGNLGRYSLFVSQDASVAVSYLQQAVALNPHVARYWLDLAAAYEVAGNLPRQRAALESALRAEPTAPDVAWEAANFYLVQDKLERALPLFRVVMANDPEQMNAALRLCWRITHNVNTMLTEAVPGQTPAYFAFLNMLTATGATVPAETVWHSLINLGQPFSVSEAFPFFDYLLEKQETRAAVEVWQDLVRRNHQLETYSQPGNLVLDGGLERDFLNGGFDWRYSLDDQVELSVDSQEFHGGNQSVRMVFKGPGIGDAGLFEYVPVQPNMNYRFSAYTKAEELESASGPRVSVADAYTGRSYVLTDDVLGTTGWREQTADFQTGPETSLLVVKVTRVPGDPLIKGKFWIDDVSLAQH